MSDSPRGPGWWQASDDKWYPPEAVPRSRAGTPPSAASTPGPTPTPGPAPGPTPTPPGGVAPPVPPGQTPYGMPPGAVGPPPAPNRTPLFVVGGVVLVALLVALVVALTGGDDEQPSTTGPGPVQPTEPTVGSLPESEGPGELPEIEQREPPPIEDLEVVEQGFTTFQSGDDLLGSYGFVVENTGDEPFEDVPVSLTFLDSAGNVVGEDSGISGTTIGLVQPGEQLAVAGALNTVSLGILDPGTTDVAEMEIAFGEPGFDATYGDLPPDGTIEVSAIASLAEANGDHETTFTMTSTYPVEIQEPKAYLIYRNAAGDIIGGARSGGLDGAMPFLPADGSATFTITAILPVQNLADIAETEVYIDPGARLDPDPGAAEGGD